MNAEQRALFEAYCRMHRRSPHGPIADAHFKTWQACCAANAIDQPLHAIVKCLDCAGSGRIGINMEVCTTCLGAGWIYQEGTDQPQPPADDERERLRDLLRRCLAHVEQYDNLRTEIEAALAKWEER